MSNVEKFYGKHALKKAAAAIALKLVKGERWEVVENQTERTIIMRRKHWGKK